LFSYREPIACIYKRKNVVLVNSAYFSVTTSGHTSQAVIASRQYNQVICEDLRVEDDTNKRKYNLDRLRAQILHNVNKYTKAITLDYSSEVHVSLDMYRVYRRFCHLRPDKLAKIDLDGDFISELCGHFNIELPERIENKRRNALVRFKDDLETWRKGFIRLVSHPYKGNLAYLRVRKADRSVETSKGITIMNSKALELWALISGCRISGKRFTPDGPYKVGTYFSINYIEGNGDLVAGCHTVPYSESERVAQELGFFEVSS